MNSDEITFQSLVGAGLQGVHAIVDTPQNRKLTREAAAKITRGMNTAPEIRMRFVDVPHLYSKKHKAGTIYSNVPSGPYFEGSILSIAIQDADMQNEPHQTLPTRHIENYDPELQLNYQKLTLASILAIERLFPEYAPEYLRDYMVLYTENSAAVISNEEFRTGRTIAPAHGQSYVLPMYLEGSTPTQITGLLAREAQLIRVFQHQMIEQLDKNTSELSVIKRNTIRLAPPYGYIIETAIENKMPISIKAQILTEIMQHHHSCYAKQTQDLVELINSGKYPNMKRALIPQPSYKKYIYYKNDRINISISPSYVSPAGVIEALDRTLDRKIAYPSIFKSQNQSDFYYLQLSDRISELMS